MTKGVLFDKDGTLFEFDSMWTNAIAEFVDQVVVDAKHPHKLAQALGIKNGVVMPDSALSSGTIKDIADVLFNNGVYQQQSDAENFVRSFFLEFLKTHLDQLKPIGDLQRLMENLHADDIKVGIVTSDDYEATLISLQHAGITDLVDFIASGDCYPRKPDPAPLLTFCQKFALALDDVIMVGDSRMDIELGNVAKGGVAVLSGVGTKVELADLTAMIYADVQAIPYATLLK